MIRENCGKVTTGEKVAEFILKHFGVDYSTSTISSIVRSLGFSSRMAKSTLSATPIEGKMDEMVTFVEKVRRLVNDSEVGKVQDLIM